MPRMKAHGKVAKSGSNCRKLAKGKRCLASETGDGKSVNIDKESTNVKTVVDSEIKRVIVENAYPKASNLYEEHSDANISAKQRIMKSKVNPEGST